MLKRKWNSILSIAFKLYSLYTLLAQCDARKIQNQKLPKSNTNELPIQESELKKLYNFRNYSKGLSGESDGGLQLVELKVIINVLKRSKPMHQLKVRWMNSS